MTSQISIRAYYSIPDLQERQSKVLQTLVRCPGASSNDIARIAKMDPKNVRSRLLELRNDGKVRVIGQKIDRITGYKVNQYEVIA